MWKYLEAPWVGRVDERIYGLMRISYALVALINLIDLWKYREGLYTDFGFNAVDVDGQGYGYTLFILFRTEPAVSAYFVFSGIVLVLLALGVFPRTMVFLALVWSISYTYRLGPAVGGWDRILRVYAFLLLVSPLGNWWSLPRLLGWGKAALVEKARMVPNYGMTLMKIQLVVLYWHTGILKFPDEAWQRGEALNYMLVSVFSHVQSPVFANYPFLIKLGSYAALIGEILIPVLLCFRKTRWLGFLWGWGLHLIIALTCKHLLLFSLSMFFLYFAFLDGESLKKIGGWVGLLRGRGRRKIEDGA